MWSRKPVELGWLVGSLEAGRKRLFRSAEANELTPISVLWALGPSVLRVRHSPDRRSRSGHVLTNPALPTSDWSRAGDLFLPHNYAAKKTRKRKERYAEMMRCLTIN